MFDLSSRLALVTGSGQGIGAGIAGHLAARGATVLVNDIDPEKAERSAAKVREAGHQADACAFDVTDREAVAKALAGRPVDIVVNNAGNAGAETMRPRPFREMPPEQWNGPIDVNLHGVLNTTHATLPGMCERGHGRLITISSGAGVVGLPIGVATYGAGKGGALAFMRHMAIENAGLGVTANSLALGLMEMTQVTDASGQMIPFTPADLETLPTYAMVTLTPWRERPARFEGVLLSDLLRETGLYDSAAIRVTAENDYITTIPRAVWTSLPILIATRVDGAPHSRRERGPIQFVIDMDAHRSTDLAREEYMVWMASRLEAAD